MFEIIIILALILFNGVFSMVEIALVSSRRTRLEVQAQQGDARAVQVLKQIDNPDRFLSTIQIGITGIGILTGMFSGEHFTGILTAWLTQFSVLMPYAQGIATVLVLSVITYITLVLGELLPKRLGLNSPEAIAKFAVAPMSVLTRLAYPCIWLLSISTSLLIRIFGLRKDDTPVTEEEIKAVILQGKEQGTIEPVEQEIMERVLHLNDRSITSLMTPRSDIRCLPLKTVREVKALLRKQSVYHYSYPVSDGELEDMQGIVKIRDILLAKNDVLVMSLATPAVFALEHNTAYQVLEIFKREQTHHAFIVNEFGHIEGIVTLNDILQALVGEVPTPLLEQSIVERPDGSFLVDGQLSLYEFMQRFGVEEERQGEQVADTVAGFVLHTLGKLPVTGEQFVWNGFTVEIIDMDNQRIDKLLLIPIVRKKK